MKLYWSKINENFDIKFQDVLQFTCVDLNHPIVSSSRSLGRNNSSMLETGSCDGDGTDVPKSEGCLSCSNRTDLD